MLVFAFLHKVAQMVIMSKGMLAIGLAGRWAVSDARSASVAAKTVKTSAIVRMVSRPQPAALLTPALSAFVPPPAARQP